MNNSLKKDRPFPRDVTNIVISEIPIQPSMEARLNNSVTSSQSCKLCIMYSIMLSRRGQKCKFSKKGVDSNHI